MVWQVLEVAPAMVAALAMAVLEMALVAWEPARSARLAALVAEVVAQDRERCRTWVAVRAPICRRPLTSMSGVVATSTRFAPGEISHA